MEQVLVEPSSQDAGASTAPAFPSAAAPAITPSSPPAAIPSPPAAGHSVQSVTSADPAAASAVREDQVQNAVGFLSHPQVRGSTNTASKRAFLERKGLTAAEVEEAFRRVPEAPPQPVPTASAAAPTPPPAVPPAAYAPQPAVPQSQHHYGAAASPAGALVAVQPAPPGAMVQQVAPGYRWSQIVLGVGAVVAAGWAVHQLVVPRLRSLVDSWQSQRREAEEARQKELQAAVASLKGCQEELRVSTQALVEAVTLMREQQRSAAMEPMRAGVAGRTLGGPYGRESYYQGANGRNDMSYGVNSVLGSDNYAAIRAAAGYTNAYPPDPPPYTLSGGYGRESGPATAGPTGGDGGGRGGAAGMYGASNTPYGAVRSAAAHPYGGSGSGSGGQQQQENMPYRVTAPPSPAHSTYSMPSGRPQQQQPIGGLGSLSGPYGSSDRLYDQSVSGGVGMGDTGAKVGAASAAATSDSAAGSDGRTVPRPPPEQPTYPQSFHEVMEMVQKGITPPNVRQDINDSPPDPTRPFSEARMQAPLKPWERAAAGSGASSGNSAGTGLLGASSSSLYGGTALTGRSSGMSYGWGMGTGDPASSSTPLTLPPPTFGMSSSATATGGTAGGSGSGVGGSSAGGGTGRVSNNGAAGGSGLNVLPPANPAWRPPPPPMRTVVSSITASPAVAAQTAGGGEAAPAVAAAGQPAAVEVPAGAAPAPLAAEVPEVMTALAGPPSPSPSQPAFVSSATGPLRAPGDLFASDIPADSVPAQSSPPPPPPPAELAAVYSSADGAGSGSLAATDV